MKAERLYREFRPRGVPDAGGLLLLRADDASDLVGRAADEGVPVLGIGSMRVGAGGTEAPAEHAADFSAAVAQGHGCWVDAEAFLRARAGAGLVFEVTLGDDPVEAV